MFSQGTTTRGKIMEETARAAAISRALDAYREQKLTRTETIEFRGSARSFEVVTINPEVPILNPNNSRLRAQLLNHPGREIVKTAPTSAEAQEILAGLLAQTDKFEELKLQIKDFKQQDPGIISRSGLLINGNTRLTAVKSLGLSGFDVAVLPEDANDDDFFSIEMALQLRKLVHQDYTFTNELLLVDNHLKRTANEESTIQAMQWKREGKKRLKQYQGYLALIEEIRQFNPKLTYEFFDSKAELIKNLYQQYSTLAEHSLDKAETLKQTRILGLFLGLNKDEVREMDEYFIEERILPDVAGDELENIFSENVISTNVSALDQLLDENSGLTLDLTPLISKLAGQVIDGSGGVSDSLIESNYHRLHQKVRSQARQIREERIDSEMRAEPIEYLKDVTKRVQELADKIPQLFQDSKFDHAKFEFQAKKTQQAILSLQKALNRTTGV